jgi:hydrogenase maturation protease
MEGTAFDAARGIANAILYEGYLLYPYTASASKNQMRWQFGVVVPKAYEAAGTLERGNQRTEFVIEVTGTTRIDALLRFLHVEARSVEALQGDAYVEVATLDVDGTRHVPFDETVECEVPLHLDLATETRATVPVGYPASLERSELRDRNGAPAGRTLRERWPLYGTFSLAVEPVADAPTLRKLIVETENTSEIVAAGVRGEVLRTAFISTHTLLAIEDGAFLSPIDPPEYAAAATESLANRGPWPVLMGDGTIDAQRSTLAMSTPIVLGDFPELGKKTEADAFDGTEIDELLTLSVLSLSDAERAEARATDPRARAIVERAERFGAADIARLHDGELSRIADGVLARLNDTDFSSAYAGERSPFNADGLAAESRFTDPRTRSLVDLANPEEAAAAFNAGDVARLRSGDLDPLEALPPASILVNGVAIGKGSSVKLSPKRRADAWDTFLEGRMATVKAIHQDFEDKIYVAVTVDVDPATDLHDWYGRSFFFEPDEVEPVDVPAHDAPKARVLVAGVGNLFFLDDGFGPEVARRLAAEAPIPGAHVEDYGIRGLHLAYELRSGYDAAVIVDAVPRGEAPGTLYVIEPSAPEHTGAPDAHRMDLTNVFAFLRMLGGEAPPITIVGCEPATVEEGIGLSPAVANAVESALPLVRRVVNDVLSRKGTPWSEALS